VSFVRASEISTRRSGIAGPDRDNLAEIACAFHQPLVRTIDAFP